MLCSCWSAAAWPGPLNVLQTGVFRHWISCPGSTPIFEGTVAGKVRRRSLRLNREFPSTLMSLNPSLQATSRVERSGNSSRLKSEEWPLIALRLRALASLRYIFFAGSNQNTFSDRARGRKEFLPVARPILQDYRTTARSLFPVAGVPIQ